MASPPPPPAQPAPAPDAYQDAVRQLRQRCDGGQAGGCLALGLLYRDGTLVERDGAAARRFFRKACNGGVARACAELAAPGADAPVVAAPPPASGATVLTSKQVWVNGKLVGDGGGGSPAVATGTLASLPAMFRKECDAGNQQGCVALGLEYWEGTFVQQDRAKGRRLLQGACDGGDEGGCKVLEMLERNLKPSLVAPKAGGAVVVAGPTQLVVTSDGASTQALSTHLAAGLLSGVLGMLQKACGSGNSQACVGLGLFCWKGQYVPKDRAKARRLWKSACDAGDKTGCTIEQTLEAAP